MPWPGGDRQATRSDPKRRKSDAAPGHRGRGPYVGMRQLGRRLSRVQDSSSSSPPPSPADQKRRRGSAKDDPDPRAVPEGHVPVIVGEAGSPDDGSDEDTERFLVRAEMLGRPALAELLGRAAQEYGYDHRGPLRIPCSPAAFRRALASCDADR